MKNLITKPFQASTASRKMLGMSELYLCNSSYIKSISISELSNIKDLPSNNVVSKSGATYFLFSSSSEFMKIGRAKTGDATARIRSVLRDSNYKQYNFDSFFIIDQWAMEKPMHDLFASQRATYFVNDDRASYKDWCAFKGYGFRRCDAPTYSGTNTIELFKTENFKPEKIREIVINKLLSKNIKVITSQ